MRQQEVRTVRYGLKTILYRAPQLWSLVPEDLKTLPNVNLFKSKVKHWECTECHCKLCKTYLKIQVMFNVFSQLIKLCNKVMRISEHFCLQVFLYQTFSYLVFQSSIKGAIQECHKISEIELSHKQNPVLNPPLNFSRC